MNSSSIEPLISNARAAFVLPPSLELAQAEPLHAALSGLIAREGPLCIEGGGVERVSTACVQVLAAAAIAARGSRRPFELASPSSILSNAVRDLGLQGVFGLEK
jgi:chemotaxis protein CheX